MKEILLSVKPKHCRNIFNGDKSFEIRKTKPKGNGIYKCYIYCTKGSRLPTDSDKSMFIKIYDNGKIEPMYLMNGKVIGEFICEEIIDCVAELYNNDDDVYQDVSQIIWDEYFEYWETSKSICNEDYTNEEWRKQELPQTKVTIDELNKYLGDGLHEFYLWKISKLKIYDKPKSLSEFNFKKAPQSWCYVNKKEK